MSKLPGSPTRLLQLCPWGPVPFLRSCLQILIRIAPFSLLETKSSFPTFCAAHLPFLLSQMLSLFQPLFVVTISERNFLVSLLLLPKSKWDIGYVWHLPFARIRSNLQFQNISGPPKCRNQSCALSLCLVESFSQKQSPRNFYRLKTSLLLSSSVEKNVQFKVVGMYFSFSWKHLQGWPELPVFSCWIGVVSCMCFR